MDARWIVEAFLAAFFLFGLLWFERQIRIWRWQRARQKNTAPLDVDESEKGIVRGAAKAIVCGRCQKRIKDFHEYADGDKWCEDCHQGEPQGAVDVRR